MPISTCVLMRVLTAFSDTSDITDYITEAARRSDRSVHLRWKDRSAWVATRDLEQEINRSEKIRTSHNSRE